MLIRELAKGMGNKVPLVLNMKILVSCAWEGMKKRFLAHDDSSKGWVSAQKTWSTVEAMEESHGMYYLCTYRHTYTYHRKVCSMYYIL